MNCKSVLISLCLLIASLLPGNCLGAADSESPKIPAQNAVYTELLGQGLGLGLYYDRMFGENLAARVGVSTLGVGYGIPFGLSYLTKGNHKFEIGAGAAYFEIHDFWAVARGFVGSMNIGYRYQQEVPGFMMRAAFTPLFGKEFVPFVGLSFGLTF